jgi:hypothetical protein
VQASAKDILSIYPSPIGERAIRSSRRASAACLTTCSTRSTPNWPQSLPATGMTMSASDRASPATTEPLHEDAADSHAVYWWTIGSDGLSVTARSLIENKANTILVSAVSFYELDNNVRLRKLDLKP